MFGDEDAVAAEDPAGTGDVETRSPARQVRVKQRRLGVNERITQPADSFIAQRTADVLSGHHVSVLETGEMPVPRRSKRERKVEE